MKQKMSFWKIADWLEKHLIYQFGMMRGAVRSRLFQSYRQ